MQIAFDHVHGIDEDAVVVGPNGSVTAVIDVDLDFHTVVRFETRFRLHR